MTKQTKKRLCNRRWWRWEESVNLNPIQKRIDELEGWLMQETPEVFTQQNHLDKNLPERAYWHYGYLMALKDVLAGRVTLGSGPACPNCGHDITKGHHSTLHGCFAETAAGVAPRSEERKP